MNLTTSMKVIGILAAGLVYAFNASAIICEFDDNKPMCKNKQPQPYCAHVNGCEPDLPKEVCLDFRDRPGICLIASDKEDVLQN